MTDEIESKRGLRHDAGYLTILADILVSDIKGLAMTCQRQADRSLGRASVYRVQGEAA